MFFFDTYAFFEILEGNANYQKYSSVNFFTSRLNLMEFHYGLVLSVGEQKARKYYEENLINVIDFTDEDIIKATIFKANHKSQKLSYVDCVGYILSLRLGIKFLTGDKEFEQMENVEFVK